jgi:lipopolysaccharide biosynthesis glycosyltransferase
MTCEEIDIAFGTSSLYAPHVAAAISSLVRASPGARLRFIILHEEGIGPDRRARVEAAAPGARFVWKGVGRDDAPPYADREHLSRAILFRLGLEKLAPADCRRVIYLDADLIVLGDLRDLWRIDLRGAPIGAVADAYLDPRAFAQRWGLAQEGPGYFNSGVLLIDLEQVRAQQSFKAAIDFVEQHANELKFADQDALNYVFWGRWRPLPPTWNAQRHMVLPIMSKALPQEMQFHDRLPKIVQFTEAEKPWVRGAYHPWSWLYWDSLARTRFLSEVAATWHVSPLERLRIWFRWQRRRP